MENYKLYTLRSSSHMWRQSAGSALQLPLVPFNGTFHVSSTLQAPEFLFLHCIYAHVQQESTGS